MSIGTIIVLALLLVALFFLGRSALAELILIFDKDRFKREVSQTIDELMEKFPQYPREFMEDIFMLVFKVVTTLTFIGVFIIIALIIAIV